MRIGIDLGGTKIEGCALDDEGRLLARERVATPRDDYAETLAAIVRLVATVEGGENILKTAIDAFGRVDILVNNAGILRDKTLVKTDEAAWDIVVQVHLKGTYCVSRPVFTWMKENGNGGVIVNTSSTSAIAGMPYGAAYGASKAGVMALTRSLAVEYGKKGLRANAVSPGSIKTGMTTRANLPADLFQ